MSIARIIPNQDYALQIVTEDDNTGMEKFGIKTLTSKEILKKTG